MLEHAQGVLAHVVLAGRIAGAAARVCGDLDKTILCPFDAEPLARVVADGVDVDTCRIHGAWFDAGGVRRIANAFTTQPEEQSRTARGASSPPGD